MSTAAAPTVDTNITGSAGKFSIGPCFMEIQDTALISGNTSMVATAASLSRVDYAIFIAGGLGLTALTTYSGNTATFTFTDPVATIKGTVILFGR